MISPSWILKVVVMNLFRVVTLNFFFCLCSPTSLLWPMINYATMHSLIVWQNSFEVYYDMCNDFIDVDSNILMFVCLFLYFMLQYIGRLLLLLLLYILSLIIVCDTIRVCCCKFIGSNIDKYLA